MQGMLLGRSYRVAGRMRVGLQADGQTWFWTEYYLVEPDGSDATLVYEDADGGAAWRLFKWVDLDPPMSAAQAATRQEGDTFELLGRTARVTSVGDTRVWNVDGQAPDGVQEGDTARCFNAERGNEMVVVSWTGDEVECYSGQLISPYVVKAAFNLAEAPTGLPSVIQQSPAFGIPSASRILSWMILATSLIAVALFVASALHSDSPRKLERLKVSKPHLQPGRSGTLDGERYRVQSRITVEIQRVGRGHTRHEYLLVNSAGDSAVLIQGSESSDGVWTLLKPMVPKPELSPNQAGEAKLGDAVLHSDSPMRLTQMFQTRVLSVQGEHPWFVGAFLYGFEARGGDDRVVARWRPDTIEVHRAVSLAASDVTAAFR